MKIDTFYSKGKFIKSKKFIKLLNPHFNHGQGPSKASKRNTGTKRDWKRRNDRETVGLIWTSFWKFKRWIEEGIRKGQANQRSSGREPRY